MFYSALLHSQKLKLFTSNLEGEMSCNVHTRNVLSLKSCTVLTHSNKGMEGQSKVNVTLSQATKAQWGCRAITLPLL